MSAKDIIGAVGAALAVLWGFYVEMRLHKAENANEALKRSLYDTQIQDQVKALPDSSLRSDLDSRTKS